VLAADEAFFTMQDARLGSWARGYDDEASVFDAVASDSKYALVDPSVLPSGFNDYEFQVKGLKVEDDRFDAFELEYTDVMTGREARVTVIGVLAIQVPPQYTAGVYVNQAAYTATFGEPAYLRSYVRFNDGVKVKAASESIESALLTQGVQAETTKSLLDASVQENNSFIRMFQGFMALGVHRHRSAGRHRLPLGHGAQAADRHAAGHRLPDRQHRPDLRAGVRLHRADGHPLRRGLRHDHRPQPVHERPVQQRRH
jgi:hypothetical protein